MTVTLYATPSASTRKAKEWLSRNGILFKERDIKKSPLTIAELQQILSLTVEGTDEIIATRSNIYKDLNLDFDSLSLIELLNLIQQHPGLLRNPIITDSKKLQVGYNEEEIRQFLPRKTRKLQWLEWKMNNSLMARG